MSDSIRNYVLVRKGCPRVYKDKREAVAEYLSTISNSPNAYRHEVKPSKMADPDVIDKFVEQLTNDEKLTFYAFDNNTAPTAIALYQVDGKLGVTDWYNKAAKENPKNQTAFSEIEQNMRMRCEADAVSKTLALGDFIYTDGGKEGRIEIITNEYIAINFNSKPDHCFPVSNTGAVLNKAGSSLDLYQKPIGGELRFEGVKMGTYWAKGAGCYGQGHKRVDIYAQANIWHVGDVRTFQFEPFQ
jgi:preprotein translocase subunit YajC